MFDDLRILELEAKGLVRRNLNNLSNYALIIDEDIKTDYCSFEICLWKNGHITFKDTIKYYDCNGEVIGNKITGKGSKVYRLDIQEAIKEFKKKHKEVLDYISSNKEKEKEF